MVLANSAGVRAAEDLQLRPGISFDQDIDNDFPIAGKHLEDTTIDKDRPAFIFFGASGDFNTNRQAKRFIEIYRKESGKPLKFIVVDVDHPVSDQCRNLIKTYYRGYIPCEVLLDRTGKVAWQETGEVKTSIIKDRIDELQ
jgi:hypothetical protein